MADNTASNIVGLVTGVLGIALSVVSITFTMVKRQLPSTKLREFDEVWDKTDALLRSALEEGLFLHTNYISLNLQLLRGIKRKAEDYRASTNAAKTWRQELGQMRQGPSKKIAALRAEVVDIRADVSTTSAQERERLRMEERLGSPPSSNHGERSMDVDQDVQTLCATLEAGSAKSDERLSPGQTDEASHPAASGAVSVVPDGSPPDANDRGLGGDPTSLTSEPYVSSPAMTVFEPSCAQTHDPPPEQLREALKQCQDALNAIGHSHALLTRLLPPERSVTT